MVTKAAKTTKKTASVKASKKTVAVKKKSTVKKAAKTTTKTVARKKTAVKKTTTKKAAIKKTAKQPIKKQNTKFIVSHEQRHRMISEAAYFISLKSGHVISDPIYNWFEAEHSIDLICECEHR